MANELEPKPHRLWDPMRRPAPVPPTSVPTASPPPDNATDEPTAAEGHAPGTTPGKGLWAMMGVKAPAIPESALVEPSISEVEEGAPAAPPPAWFRGRTEAEPH